GQRRGGLAVHHKLPRRVSLLILLADSVEEVILGVEADAGNGVGAPVVLAGGHFLAVDDELELIAHPSDIGVVGAISAEYNGDAAAALGCRLGGDDLIELRAGLAFAVDRHPAAGRADRDQINRRRRRHVAEPLAEWTDQLLLTVWL